MGKVKIALIGVVMLMLGFEVAAPAGASTPGEATRSGTGDHCVLNLVSNAVGCVSDGSQMDVARRLAAGDNKAALATVVNAKLYKDFITSGTASLEIRSAADCTASKSSVEYSIGNLASYSFSDITSSFETFGNCQIRLYDVINCPSSSATYPGATTWAGTTTYVGDPFNDKATCVYVS